MKELAELVKGAASGCDQGRRLRTGGPTNPIQQQQGWQGDNPVAVRQQGPAGSTPTLHYTINGLMNWLFDEWIDGLLDR